MGSRFGGRYESGDYESGLRALLWHFLTPHGDVAFVLPNNKIHGTHIEKVSTCDGILPQLDEFCFTTAERKFEDAFVRISSMTNSFPYRPLTQP